MAKILLIGYLPPNLISNSKIEAANYRTWQFAGPLLSEGHQIYLCAKSLSPAKSEVSIPPEWQNDLTVQIMPFHTPHWRGLLQKVHDRFKPDVVVAVNFDSCLYATKLSTDRPIWMDIYGDPLTIMQAAFYRAGSDRGLPTSIDFLRQALRKGDKFSVCGFKQRDMLVGELAMAGRLNYHSFGYQFVEVIFPGALPKKTIDTDKRRKKPNLQRLGIKPEDFVVLWCGGYNTWTDVDTLFSGLEWAMQEDARIHYVSIGENTYQASDNVYSRFLDRIAHSTNPSRYHMLGWRPWSEIDGFYSESDVGINIDALHYETIYGTRTRLLEMMAAGLPIITSLGSELSYMMSENEVSFSFEIGNWKNLGEEIYLLANNPGLLEKLSSKSLAFTNNQLSFMSTSAPIRSWVLSPSLAPDQLKDRREKWLGLSHKGRSIIRRTLWEVLGSDK